MKFLCPTCHTPLPGAPAAVVACTACGVAVDLTRVETAPGTASLPPEVDLSGEKLGEWTLADRIGAGGMGAVYQAQGAQGACAVKVLSSLLAAEPAVRERFKREAGALRAIAHPSVVRILSEGEERGFCWYAMERVEGSDLRSRLAAGPLPAAEVEAMAVALLGALGAVHAQGVVHRDVKPANILLSPQGPKLCDFGIARFDGSATLTESAAMLGSLRYMAPEQRRGKADARSDLYSLGLSLHEAWTGGLPPETALPAAPAPLRRLISLLTAERPEERPATAADAAALLKPRRRSAAWVAGGWSAVAAAAVALVLSLRGASPATTAVPERPMTAPAAAANEPPPPAPAQQQVQAQAPPNPPPQVAKERPVELEPLGTKQAYAPTKLNRSKLAAMKQLEESAASKKKPRPKSVDRQSPEREAK